MPNSPVRRRWQTLCRRRKCRRIAKALGKVPAYVIPVCATAAQAQAPSQGVDDEDVVVRGSQSGGFSSRASIQDAPREITDAASLIEPLPGVHVRRLGGEDSFATISIRGSTSNQVAIVLAGVPLTGGADPSLDLATLPLWPGVRAHVYRSFAPGALGPGSLGGTLALEPPRPSDPAGTEVWAAAGSFGALRMRSADVRALDANGARVVTALSASRADDDFSYFDPGIPPDGAFTTRTNAGHAAVNGLASLALPLQPGSSSTGTLTVTTLAQGRRQHLPGAVSGPTPFAMLDSNRELAAVELAEPAGAGAWSARAWGRREDLRLRDVAASDNLGPTHTNDAIVATGGSIGWRGRVAPGLTFEGRGDGSGERFAPGETIGAAQPPGVLRRTLGASADLDWVATHAWTLSATGRVDGHADHADDGTTTSDMRPTGHLGTELALGPAKLSAHGGALARPPSFIELYGNRGGIVGTPGLRTESAWTLDAGARYATRARALRALAELVGFATWADDLITFVPQGAYSELKAANIGKARLLGVEAEVDLRAGGLDLRLSYTGLATSAELGMPTPCGAPPLPGRPEHDFVGDVAYTVGPVRARYGLDALAGMRADLAGCIGIPPRVLQSAGLRFDVPGAPGLRLALDIRNLFDERTALYAGGFSPVTREPIGDQYDYPLPGRSVLVSARWTSSP